MLHEHKHTARLLTNRDGGSFYDISLLAAPSWNPPFKAQPPFTERLQRTVTGPHGALEIATRPGD